MCVCMHVQAVLTALSDELLCVNTELRVVYDAYSGRQGQRPWAWGQPEHNAALTSAQLWLLLRECNVPEPDCSVAHINMALAQVREFARPLVPIYHHMQEDGINSMVLSFCKQRLLFT